jgi:adenine-specific DNA methylase
VRGVPFLAFEMLRTSVTLINDQSNLISSVLMKEFSLQNIEKQSAPQVIIRSGNVDTIDVRVARKESMEQQSAGSDILFDPEEEDNINDGLIDDHDIDEYFTKVFVDVNKSQQDYKVVASFGLTELEIAEFSTRKLIDNFASDWTATPQQSQAQ